MIYLNHSKEDVMNINSNYMDISTKNFQNPEISQEKVLQEDKIKELDDKQRIDLSSEIYMQNLHINPLKTSFESANNQIGFLQTADTALDEIRTLAKNSDDKEMLKNNISDILKNSSFQNESVFQNENIFSLDEDEFLNNTLMNNISNIDLKDTNNLDDFLGKIDNLKSKIQDSQANIEKNEIAKLQTNNLESNQGLEDIKQAHNIEFLQAHIGALLA